MPWQRLIEDANVVSHSRYYIQDQPGLGSVAASLDSQIGESRGPTSCLCALGLAAAPPQNGICIGIEGEPIFSTNALLQWEM